MSEENGKKEEFAFKITDKRFSAKISESSKRIKESESEKDKIHESYDQGEEKKKSIKERLFGKKKIRPNEEIDVKLEELDDSISASEIDFSSFILSLSTQAMIHLGEIPNPITNKKEKELTLAKQTIDLIGMLKEKTKNNLTENEEQLIENLLYDLRIKYLNDIKETR